MAQNSIKSGAIISYISIVVNILISLIYTPWMIREIGMSDYGIYSLIISFLSYFLLDFGLGSSISRFIAKYRADNDKEGIDKMFSVTTFVYIFLDIVIFLVLSILFLYIEDIFTGLTVIEISTLKKVYLIAGVFSLCTFGLKPFDGAMMAYEHFVPLKSMDLVQRLGTVLLISISLLIGGNIYVLVFINGFVALAVSLCKLCYLFKHENIHISVKLFDRNLAKELFTFSSWVFLINLAQRLRLNIVPSILGVFCNTTEISVFSVGMNLEGFIFTFSYALNGLFIPKVARIVKADDNRGEVTELMIKVGRIQLIIVGFIIIGLFGLGRSFIHLWIGDEFRDTYWVMVLLVAIYFISMTQHIGTTLSYVVNEVRYNSIFAFSSSLLSFILSLLMSPSWGAIGCAAAVCIALCTNTVMLNFFYKKKLHLNIGLFFRECHFKLLPLCIPLLMVLVIVDNTIGLNSWGELLIGGLAYTLTYFSLMYFCGMTKEEKLMIKQIKPNKIWKQK